MKIIFGPFNASSPAFLIAPHGRYGLRRVRGGRGYVTLLIGFSACNAAKNCI